jgi:hypothetical protein
LNNNSAPIIQLEFAIGDFDNTPLASAESENNHLNNEETNSESGEPEHLVVKHSKRQKQMQ